MKLFYYNFLQDNLYFWMLSTIAVILIIISFFVPPMGIISSSVLQAVAELFAWAALGAVIHSIDLGKKTTIKHGATEVSVGAEDKDE